AMLSRLCCATIAPTVRGGQRLRERGPMRSAREDFPSRSNCLGVWDGITPGFCCIRYLSTDRLSRGRQHYWLFQAAEPGPPPALRAYAEDCQPRKSPRDPPRALVHLA